MKKIITLAILSCSVSFAYAQEGAFKLGFRLAPYTNIASIDDNDPTPSQIRYVADGLTIKEENAAGVGVSIYLDYFFTDHFAFSTGFWFTQKNFTVHNYDGWDRRYNDYPYYGGYTYHGVSYYKSTYFQLPFLLKFLSGDLVKNLRLYLTVGPTIDFRTGEKLDGNDYAHYWNMSRHITGYDHWRGRNASGRPTKLFNPVDVTLYLSAGVNYEVVDRLELFLGIMLNKGFVNAINPKLRFDEPSQTKVNTDQNWKSFLVGAELGVAYNLGK